ncbi:MAG TPA: hypothetical protein VFF26_12535 [Gallionella sp.]|nr:hypothetical protein [Gallionella sp.]
MTARYLYRLYGLLAASDLPLPELFTVAGGQPQIFFRYANIPQDRLEERKQLGPFHTVSPGRLWLHVPNIARFLVLDGKEVWIDPSPGIDEDSIRVFLLGACVGALLMQRGLLVLRGCAVRVGDGCILCLGDSASGKTTLAAALMQRGHAVLSDDIVAIDNKNCAIPGFPDLKLWHDAAKKLGIPTEGLRRTRSCIEKFHVPLGDFFQNHPLPVRRIYALQPDNSTEFRLEHIAGMERFSCLHACSYRPLYIESMQLKGKHLQSCAAFSGNIPMQYLFRPEHPFMVKELADFILADMGRTK